MKKITYLLLIILFTMSTCKKTEDTCIDENKINENGICTYEFDPVCGCDGKTYSNACHAANAGVTKFSKGACSE